MSVISPVITLNCAHYRKSRTLAAVAHIYEEKWKRYLLRPFFSFFSVRVSPFFTSSRIIIFNKENIINFFIRKKRLFWSFAFQCFVQLRTTILRSVPIFVKVAHIFSRFCLLDTGNINLHQSTAEK